MARVIHFELPVQNPDTAVAFYEAAFGWKIKKWDGPVEYWLVDTGDGDGINGGVMRLQKETAPRTPINTVGVESLDQTLAQIEAAGGTITMPKHAIPGIGWFAYITDPEGIVTGVMQPDPSAG